MMTASIQNMVLGSALIAMTVGCTEMSSFGGAKRGPAGDSSLSSQTYGSGQFTFSNSAAGSVPRGFGVAHQLVGYNPKGALSNVFVDGANDALSLGIKTFKINISRGALLSNFYQIPQSQLNSVNSMVEMSKLPAYNQVLEMPFDTIFLDADNISLDGRSANYWNFDAVAMTAYDEQAVYNETYDFGVYLLTKFAATNRTFVIQNHEGDWHTLVNGVDANGNTVLRYDLPGSDVGLENFRKYWTVRQRAIDDARKAVASQAKLYHMCEVVRLAGLVDDSLAGTRTVKGKSLTRDVLPQVTCDLVGYSAHDTANAGDGLVRFTKALSLIRQHAKTSPTFGANQVIISEIAVPELLSNGAYLPQIEGIAQLIRDLLKGGMPYVLYWQMYEEPTGNYIRASNGQLSKMAQRLFQLFAEGAPAPLPAITCPRPGGGTLQVGQTVTMYASASVAAGQTCAAQVRTCQSNGVLSGSYTAASCSVDQGSGGGITPPPQVKCQAPWGQQLAVGEKVIGYMDSHAPVGGTCQGVERVCQSNGLLSGANIYSHQTCTTPSPAVCNDKKLAGYSTTVPADVNAQIKIAYDDFLGGIDGVGGVNGGGKYLAGAKYLTGLLNQGYTLDSLRRDLGNEAAVDAEIEKLFVAYLKRSATAFEKGAVKAAFLNGSSTMRKTELWLLTQPSCKN
ncbi:MAG TPA: hypothetical protein PKC28_05700 [Bdellovibrionales bacterium]|nr:hypothetical protein [Bdellovibrionales bacterium]